MAIACSQIFWLGVVNVALRQGWCKRSEQGSLSSFSPSSLPWPLYHRDIVLVNSWGAIIYAKHGFAVDFNEGGVISWWPSFGSWVPLERTAYRTRYPRLGKLQLIGA
ncbi:hypothetical protein IQ07DRAFT_146369 [Pyrenochaeta sp. DS3sAY3a]|nr:hypothetical protein IQ07DRAFT_146369 [Pyrenochaeta sp. DS3sAY3a]